MTGKICGTGSWAPPKVWDNNDLARMVDTSDEWIRERTGVVQRHIAEENEDTVTMASRAAQRALEDADIKAEEIDLIIVATISPTEIMPCVACGVQEKLGAENATCFDLNGACTGSLLALNTAQAYLSHGIYQTALVIGAEKLSGLTDWTDRGTCILFGDGAGAVVLKAEESGRYAQVTQSIGKKGGALTLRSRNQIQYETDPKAKETYIQMNGKEVFTFAVSKVPEAVKNLLSREKVPCEDIRYYLLHQANERIIRSAARRIGEDISKFPMNMDEYGNTSSASLLILLDEVKKSGKLQRGDKLILAGFGGGLTYGASLIEY
ncbi:MULTISPECIES: beta-ketoacyl-ACP synthase III [Blautia]|uniref:beta-ketoacyl-ACP synthase III n=1 Tax=Blautia TaxID=572511 RepID=UPI00156FCE56|nr:MULTISPECIES: beta-ketoacyl-ACP synthase III [Blautia]MCB5473314.1 ketoacyl-ACP synthase III [Blautia luti]NSK76781.1 ketoacyl-ACP synthase III [Blautia massiliensis (ex Durand et al. 2017)]